MGHGHIVPTDQRKGHLGSSPRNIGLNLRLAPLSLLDVPGGAILQRFAQRRLTSTVGGVEDVLDLAESKVGAFVLGGQLTKAPEILDLQIGQRAETGWCNPIKLRLGV
ncbi:hypothetical protein D9M69_582920 [compost metagenome]